MQTRMIIDKDGLSVGVEENNSIHDTLLRVKDIGFDNIHILGQALVEMDSTLAEALENEIHAQLYFNDLLKKEADNEFYRSLQPTE